MEQPKHIDMQTPNGTQLNLDALYQIAPSCFTEAKGGDGEMHRVVDFNKLRLLLGDQTVEDAPEVYDFTWVGKRAALQEAAAPINKTLRPCPEESVDQNSYMGKVKMIYIDPPYNTGNDFVYHDDFAQSAEEYDESNRDDEGNRYRKNTDSNGRFHSDWCSMIYARLMVARSLLTDDGVLFISMNDCEQRNLRNICDEIFGEANFITQLIWQQRKGGGNDSRFVATDHEYVLVYTKNIFSQNEKWKVSQSEEYQKRYNLTEPNGQKYYWDTLVRNGLQNPIIVKLTSPEGDLITLNSQWSQERVENGLKDGTVRFTKTTNGWSLHHKVYLKGGQVLRSLLTEVGTNKTACDEQVSLLGSMLLISSLALHPQHMQPCNLMRRMVGNASLLWFSFLKKRHLTAKPTKQATRISAKSVKSASVVLERKSRRNIPKQKTLIQVSVYSSAKAATIKTSLLLQRTTRRTCWLACLTTSRKTALTLTCSLTVCSVGV